MSSWTPRTRVGRIARSTLGHRYAALTRAYSKLFHGTTRRLNRVKIEARMASYRAMMPFRVHDVKRDARLAFGPRRPEVSERDVIVACVCRDGEEYVESFLDHHLALGVKHFLVLDNGSADRTIERFAKSDRVTLYRSTLEFRVYQSAFRQFLLRRIRALGCWALEVDIDELFDFPDSSVAGLGGLIAYLEEHHFTAMVVQMLDMFSSGDPREVRPTEAPLLEAYPWYDLSEIEFSEWDPSHPEFGKSSWSANSRIGVLRGGLLSTLFGVKPLLTKTPLFKPSHGVRQARIHHFVNGARAADISGVLFHFKLTSSFVRRLLKDVEEEAHPNMHHYRRMAATVENASSIVARLPAAKRFEGVDRLVEEGFLVRSPQWEAWVRRERKA